MANNATKKQASLAEVFKALGHPTRLWIVRNLANREMCVYDFVEGTSEEFSAVSQHLNVLKKAHVVESEGSTSARTGWSNIFLFRKTARPSPVEFVEDKKRPFSERSSPHSASKGSQHMLRACSFVVVEKSSSILPILRFRLIRTGRT
ncbi:MAG: metalloregulator ArsR/SmtB family transcription factor [Akkermansia sp.]|nr:metalloregulator ArsR/SmtB family transcription factor [Akkermansia sp.]